MEITVQPRLSAVLDAMIQVQNAWQGYLGKECENIMDQAKIQRYTLKKEVQRYCQERSIKDC